MALIHDVTLIGHCTDSAANSLNALIKLGTPTKYLVDHHLSFISLQLKGFCLLAPFFRKKFPSIAYACWDHSGRTVLRNLMNQNRKIIAEVQGKDDPLITAIEYKNMAMIHDLHHLKRVYPASTIKHGDISMHMHQNCDTTSRVLTSSVIDELKLHVPASNATQLYLQAAVWTHSPYRNDKFGTPPDIVRSLWAGIMTWRRWRQYVTYCQSFLWRLTSCQDSTTLQRRCWCMLELTIYCVYFYASLNVTCQNTTSDIQEIEG